MFSPLFHELAATLNRAANANDCLDCWLGSKVTLDKV